MDFWNRALGVWWGQLSGDALGSMAEIWSASDIRGRWPEGLRAIGASSVLGTLPGQLTDDSEMAIALGQALLESGTDTVDWNRVAAGYRAWYESRPFDIGRTFAQAVSTSHACATIAQDMRVAADRQSHANGALMRQSILGIWGYRLEERTIAEVARQDAQLTHLHPVCHESSAVYVAAIAQAIRWELGPKSLYDYAVDFQTRYGQEPTVLDALVKARDLTPPYFPHQGHVLTDLHNAFYRLLHGSSLEDVIVDTVAMGGDTDSNAAIAAALFGAVYEENGISDEWKSALRACRPSLDNGAQHPRPEQYWPGMSLSDGTKSLGPDP